MVDASLKHRAVIQEAGMHVHFENESKQQVFIYFLTLQNQRNKQNYVTFMHPVCAQK